MKIEELSLTSLKYFFDTVETQSLTQAAQMNFVTRSAVSQALLRLETWAGRKLMTHERKAFRLTREGESFYRQMRASYAEFKNSIEARNHVGSNSLRVGCSASLIDDILLPSLKELPSRANLHLVSGTSSVLEKKWEEGEINLALVIGEKPHHVNHKLVRAGDFVLASANGRMDGQVYTTEPRPEVRELQRTMLRNRMQDVEFCRVESWTIAAKLALALQGTCFVPDLLLGKLRKIAVRGLHARYSIWVLFQNRELLSERELQLLSLLAGLATK